MPYQRIGNGSSADTGPQAITTVVNSIEAGLEAVEAILPDKASNASVTAAQAAASQRANHTGTQTASTISDFDTRVRANRLDQMSAPTTPISLGGQKILNLGAPTDPTDAVTKSYADGLSSGGATLLSGTIINANANGVVRDGRHVIITSTGTNIVTAVGSASGITAPYFDNSYINKTMWVYTTSNRYKVTITGVSSGTQATVSSIIPAGEHSAIFGTDNTTSINTLINNMEEGQSLVFPGYGPHFVITEGNHIITKSRITVEGTGRNSSICCASMSNSVWVVKGDYPRIREMTIHHAQFWNWVWSASQGAFSSLVPFLPTSGAAVYQNPDDPYKFINGNYDDLWIASFYNNIEINQGWSSFIRRCGLAAPVYSSVSLQSGYTDMGDFHVQDCRIWSQGSYYNGAAGPHVIWYGGGDLDISGNNFQDGYQHVKLALRVNTATDPTTQFSTNLRISDNSSEDPTDCCIKIAPEAGMTFQSVVISGNTLNAAKTGGLTVVFSGPGSMANFNIIGNSSNVGVPMLTTGAQGSLLNGRILGNGHSGGVSASINCSAMNVVATY